MIPIFLFSGITTCDGTQVDPAIALSLSPTRTYSRPVVFCLYAFAILAHGQCFALPSSLFIYSHNALTHTYTHTPPFPSPPPTLHCTLFSHVIQKHLPRAVRSFAPSPGPFCV